MFCYQAFPAPVLVICTFHPETETEIIFTCCFHMTVVPPCVCRLLKSTSGKVVHVKFGVPCMCKYNVLYMHLCARSGVLMLDPTDATTDPSSHH